MSTDWNLIREMMAAVIDSFEQFEAAVKDRVAVCAYVAPTFLLIQKLRRNITTK